MKSSITLRSPPYILSQCPHERFFYQPPIMNGPFNNFEDCHNNSTTSTHRYLFNVVSNLAQILLRIVAAPHCKLHRTGRFGDDHFQNGRVRLRSLDVDIDIVFPPTKHVTGKNERRCLACWHGRQKMVACGQRLVDFVDPRLFIHNVLDRPNLYSLFMQMLRGLLLQMDPDTFENFRAKSMRLPWNRRWNWVKKVPSFRNRVGEIELQTSGGTSTPLL